jgi:hypothetical protein
VVALVAGALIMAACGNSNPTPTTGPSAFTATSTPGTLNPSPFLSPSPFPGDSASPSGDSGPGGNVLPNLTPSPVANAPLPKVTVSIVAAGDIACDPAQNTGAPRDCDQAGTAALIGALRPSAVLALGDLQYQSGTAAGFASVYAATWGRYRRITLPAVGNHEYLTSGAAGYFAYFGHIAPYYSYNLGDWHLISLDSECSHVGGCGPGSRQETWLRADLAAHQGRCVLAYWHEPRWSSGEHGDATQMATIWSDLVAGHADVVLSGHNHDYERFTPLGATGSPSASGVTEFVVGTGGKNHYAFTSGALSGEVVRNGTAFGVLRMALGPTGFSWRFYSAAGYSFTDSGSARCH